MLKCYNMVIAKFRNRQISLVLKDDNKVYKLYQIKKIRYKKYRCVVKGLVVILLMS